MLTLRVPVFDQDILAHNVASLRQAQPESSNEVASRLERLGVKVADSRHHRPLRPRHRRQRRRTAKARNEFASSHLQSSSFTIGAQKSNFSTPPAFWSLTKFRNWRAR